MAKNKQKMSASETTTKKLDLSDPRNEITAGAGSRWCGFKGNQVIGFFQISVACVYFLFQHGVDGFIDDFLPDTA